MNGPTIYWANNDFKKVIRDTCDFLRTLVRLDHNLFRDPKGRRVGQTLTPMRPSVRLTKISKVSGWNVIVGADTGKIV